MTIKKAHTRRKTARKALLRVDNVMPDEFLVFCPGCKALEIIRFNGETMVPTSRFTQKASGMYHSCGTDVPCRLHSSAVYSRAAFGSRAMTESVVPRQPKRGARLATAVPCR